MSVCDLQMVQWVQGYQHVRQIPVGPVIQCFIHIESCDSHVTLTSGPVGPGCPGLPLSPSSPYTHKHTFINGQKMQIVTIYTYVRTYAFNT